MNIFEAEKIIQNAYADSSIKHAFETSNFFVFTIHKKTQKVTSDLSTTPLDSLYSVDKKTKKISNYKPFLDSDYNNRKTIY